MSKRLDHVLLVFSGILLGVHIAIWVPTLFALWSGESIFHDDPYFWVILFLLVVLPVIGGTSSALLLRRGAWITSLRVVRWIVFGFTFVWIAIAVWY